MGLLRDWWIPHLCNRSLLETSWVKRKDHHRSLTVKYPRARVAIASERGATPMIPLHLPDETVFRYARELAKRLAREDHEAEIAARQASDPARTKSP